MIKVPSLAPFSVILLPAAGERGILCFMGQFEKFFSVFVTFRRPHNDVLYCVAKLTLIRNRREFYFTG